MNMLLLIHVAAGGLAIVLGAVALSLKKGGTVHRRSGLLFVCAMLVMGTTASILGFPEWPRLPLRRRTAYRTRRPDQQPQRLFSPAVTNSRAKADSSSEFRSETIQ